MRYRQVGSSEIEASVVTFGAWAIGGTMWGGADENEAIKAIYAALDAGINMIDTAPIYGYGRSEEIVGKAIDGRRDDVFIATKCGLRWDLEKGEFFFHADDKGRTMQPSKYKIYRYLGRESIRHEIEQSLRRLRTDYIDLYQTHWQEKTTPISERMEELLKLKQEGKIRAIGASNSAPDDLREYLKLGQLDSEQSQYSMIDRQHEQDLLPFCAENNLAFLAYSPMANGLLTGKMGPDYTFAEGDIRTQSERFAVENRRRVNNMLSEFDSICDHHKISCAQLAITWALHQHGLTHALVGARNEKQARENAAAGDVHLTDEQLQTMREIIDRYAESID